MADKYTTVIVDDSVFMRSTVTATLADTEFDVVGEGANGNEAVEQAGTHKPDLLLLDIVMPERPGPEAIEDILKASPDTKIVMLTSLGTEDMVTTCLERGAQNFIQKPFDRETLLARMRDLVA